MVSLQTPEVGLREIDGLLAQWRQAEANLMNFSRAHMRRMEKQSRPEYDRLNALCSQAMRAYLDAKHGPALAISWCVMECPPAVTDGGRDDLRTICP
jgi:hypothetical protein